MVNVQKSGVTKIILSVQQFKMMSTFTIELIPAYSHSIREHGEHSQQLVSRISITCLSKLSVQHFYSSCTQRILTFCCGNFTRLRSGIFREWNTSSKYNNYEELHCVVHRNNKYGSLYIQRRRKLNFDGQQSIWFLLQIILCDIWRYELVLPISFIFFIFVSLERRFKNKNSGMQLTLLNT